MYLVVDTNAHYTPSNSPVPLAYGIYIGGANTSDAVINFSITEPDGYVQSFICDIESSEPELLETYFTDGTYRIHASSIPYDSDVNIIFETEEYTDKIELKTSYGHTYEIDANDNTWCEFISGYPLSIRVIAPTDTQYRCVVTNNATGAVLYSGSINNLWKPIISSLPAGSNIQISIA